MADKLPIIAASISGILGTMYLDSRNLLNRDLHQLKSSARTSLESNQWHKQDRLHFYYRFKEKAKENPDKVFIIFEGKEYTFNKIEKESNRLARWLISQNVKKGEIVCMMLQNHPTFFFSLFAISKIGAIPSLINTNLADKPLLNCIRVAESRLFIFDPVFESQVASIVHEALDVHFFAYGESTELAEVPPLAFASTITPRFLADYPDCDTSEDLIKGIGKSEIAILIYTSGTTGLPKAAINQHYRLDYTISMFSKMVGMKNNERVYCVLPLYHSSGLTVCSAVTLFSGGTIVLGRKFSASKFWKDCVDYKVNVVTYIGEFCRYLLSQPYRPEEKNHKVRMVYGNGMRQNLWENFQERYGIPKVCEFYSATEAPACIFNINTGDIGRGAVGFRGKLMRSLFPEIQLIKIDSVTEEPVRDKDGLCIKCAHGEQGELVVKLDSKNSNRFDGYYKNKEATEKKIFKNVLKKGDIYFRSGDLLTMDRDGFYYFKDRIGDTFRWKSENVATTEVTAAFAEYPGIQEANVYGTLVPQHDGRAGMVALVLREGNAIDFKDLYQFLSQKLPKYAIPIFIRFVKTMDTTGTFKQQKVSLRNEGIELMKIPKDEPIFWLKINTYVPFTVEDLNRLTSGKAKL